DRLYITYVEATQGSAGWPLNVLLTPDLKPFFGGTYFSTADLESVLQGVAEAWQKDPANFTQTANQAAQKLTLLIHSSTASGDGRFEAATLDKAYQQIAASYDSIHGGFGGAPKFPHPTTFGFLLRYYLRTGRHPALEMTLHTLRAMAGGGIHDQL